MKTPPKNAPEKTIPLADVLARAGDELARLAGEVEQLQDALSDMLLGAAHSPDLLHRAQALDNVFQHAAELSAILGRAAQLSPPEWRARQDLIFSDVSLAALTGRMTGARAAPVSEELELW